MKLRWPLRLPMRPEPSGLPAEHAEGVSVPLWAPDFADGGDGVRGDAQAAAAVVQGDVLDGGAEVRAVGQDAAAADGVWQPPDGLELAAQAPKSDGASWPPEADRRVEMDESFVGGVVEGARGRGSPNRLVVGAVERVDGTGAPRPALGRLRLSVVEDASAISLMEFTKANVEEDASSMLTDGLPSHAGLPKAGFDHQRHVLGNPKNASKLLPGVHRTFSLLKRWLLGTHQGAGSPKHLQAYLNELVFRFNLPRPARSPSIPSTSGAPWPGSSFPKDEPTEPTRVRSRSR